MAILAVFSCFHGLPLDSARDGELACPELVEGVEPEARATSCKDNLPTNLNRTPIPYPITIPARS
jgi:hypothetical protein